MRMTRGKKRALCKLLSEKQKFVGAIHPIMMMLANQDDQPRVNQAQCDKVVHAATLLEDAIRDALMNITCHQIRTILHNSEVAVLRIRTEISSWRGGDTHSIDLTALLSQILPPEVMQTDEFLDISEEEFFEHQQEVEALEEPEREAGALMPLQQNPISGRHLDSAYVHESREDDLDLQTFHAASMTLNRHSQGASRHRHEMNNPQPIVDIDISSERSHASSIASSRSSRSTIRQSPIVGSSSIHCTIGIIAITCKHI